VIARAALSIRQPYAFAILHLGKRIENRGRADGKIPDLCRYRGPLLLHAPSWFGAHEVVDQALDSLEIARRNGVDLAPLGRITPRLLKEQTGGIVGRCRAVRCVNSLTELDGKQALWWCGPHALLLDDVEAFDHVIPCKGALGIFTVPPEIAAQAATAPLWKGGAAPQTS
jgi:hypothetical protein